MLLTTSAAVLDDLNDAQRAAAQVTSGPLVILAGAGTGKTRVISRRAAYAIQTGVVRTNKILLVTFTDKAAHEMVERMAALGQPGVMARTFHAHAVRQLRHFWPSRHGGEDPPQILDSKLPIIRPLCQRLPGHYRFTPSKDIADAIEWAKVRRASRPSAGSSKPRIGRPSRPTSSRASTLATSATSSATSGSTSTTCSR